MPSCHRRLPVCTSPATVLASNLFSVIKIIILFLCLLYFLFIAFFTVSNTCQVVVFDACQSAPCQNNGTCVRSGSSYQCFCKMGYEGANCQHNIDDCAGKPCLNGGTCIDQLNGFKCQCSADTTGRNETFLIIRKSKEFLPYAHTSKHIRGGLSHHTDTSEPVVGYRANVVTFQSGIRTSNLSITSPTC
jgi:hypothetical protein